MKILILADPIDEQDAGVFTYTKNIIKALLKISPEHQYIFIHKKNSEFFIKLQKKYPKQVTHHIVKRLKIPGYGSLRKFCLVPRLIKKINPDIAWETCHIGPFKLPSHIKRVVTIHDITPITHPKMHIFRSALIHKLFLRRVIKKANLILVPSKTTQNDILNYQKTKAKITITPLGIIKTKLSEIKKIIQNPYTEKKYFLYVGTIEPRKNLITLIEAFKELNLKNYELIITGRTGWKSKKIIKQAIRNPKIKLTGFIKKETLNQLYADATACIYPSIYEGFGLPPLEAMSHKTPVICSNNSSLGEIFRKYALTFSPTNKTELKQHMKNISSSPQLQKHLSSIGKS